MASLKDIAVACGVSVATVSKALNNQSDVSARTKEIVSAKARELGYFPNSAAKILKTQCSKNIGVLFADESNSGLTHDYFANVLDSFKRKAEDRGYDITFINCAKDRPNRMTYLEHAMYRGFDGVVIACIDFNDPEVVELMQSKIPVVTIDYVFNNCIAVVSDNVSGMNQLMNYIYEQGHRRIAYIHGADSAVTRNRLSSFFRTADELGLEVPDEYLRESAYRSTSRAYDQTVHLLELENPPTCILYPDDFAVFGGMNAIHDMGLRYPEDISIAGYDGIAIGRRLDPKLTTVRQDTEGIGRNAAEALINLIEKPRITLIEQITIEPSLFEGGTVKKI